MYCIGIDVHQRMSNVCVLDKRGCRVKEARVKSAELPAYIDRLPGPRRICFEASLGYGVLYDRLAPLAEQVQVAHPGHLRLIFRSKRKNDRVDARKLALLLHLDQVPIVYVPDVDHRAWRKMIEVRERRVRDRTRVKNRLRALLRGLRIDSGAYKGSKLWSEAGLTWLRSIELPNVEAELERELLFDDLAHHEKSVAVIERCLAKIAKRHPGVALLQTIPGVGPRTAEAMVAYIADPRRFRRSRQVGSYFGLVPCQDQSSDRNRLGHITRQGPGTVRRLLIEATWQALRHRNAQVTAFFAQVKRDDPERHKKALVATAHYLARCMFAMLRHGEAWRTIDNKGASGVAA